MPNRNIEFRIWIKNEDWQHSRMIYPHKEDRIALKKDVLIPDNEDSDYIGFIVPIINPDGLSFRYEFGDTLFWLDVNIMQFTGLLDKNGVKIFEGDIIQIYNSDDEPYDSKMNNWEVYYSERWAGFEVVGANSLCYYLQQYCTFEVIGNIFEEQNDK